MGRGDARHTRDGVPRARIEVSVRADPGSGIQEVSRVADKKITPKAAEGEKKAASTDKAATRVTKKRSLRRASHKRSLKD
jgi:hypothetical protein